MFNYNGENYQIIIHKKNIKNMYLRVKDDMNIYITTNGEIQKFINNNYDGICNMIDKIKNKNEKSKDFYYMGKKYDIIYNSTNNVYIEKDKIICKDNNMLNNWINVKTKEIFLCELKKCIVNTKEILPKNISLRIRKMKTRWGVCNRKNNTITLNSELIKYDIPTIDYVIYHELVHFTHANHQKEFWNLLSCYVPDYKNQKRKLKGE